MARLVPLVPRRCRWERMDEPCPNPPVLTLVTRRGKVVGDFCEGHASPALRRQQGNEDAADLREASGS